MHALAKFKLIVAFRTLANASKLGLGYCMLAFPGQIYVKFKLNVTDFQKNGPFIVDDPYVRYREIGYIYDTAYVYQSFMTHFGHVLWFPLLLTL